MDPHLMHVIVWEFLIDEVNREPFTAAYGRGGDWAKLFGGAEGYLGTELLQSTTDPSIFWTVDRWTTQACFQSFLSRFPKEYAYLDKRLEGLTSSEKKVGSFTAI